MSYNTYLYYGNGECSLECDENIVVLQISYKNIGGGSVQIESKLSSEFIFMHTNNKIMILSMNQKKLPSNLFIYSGSLKITHSLGATHDLKKIYPNITQQMDYTELLDANTETMDRLTDEIGVTVHHSKQSINPTRFIENLNTNTINETLRHEDGSEYEGDFHIDIRFNKMYSGATRSSKSVRLKRYYSPEHIAKQKRKRANLARKKEGN